jgi:ATP-dependent DNA ligase
MKRKSVKTKKTIKKFQANYDDSLLVNLSTTATATTPSSWLLASSSSIVITDNITAMPKIEDLTSFPIDITTTATTDFNAQHDTIKDMIKPVMPMLAKAITDIKKIENIESMIYEEKFDGERMLACVYNDNDNLLQPTYYTRTLKPHAGLFCNRIIEMNKSIKNCIFDGELIYTDESGNIVPICDTGTRKILNVQYRIFDIQMFNGQRVTHLKLMERKNLLRHCGILENRYVKVVKYVRCTDSKDDLMVHFDGIVDQGGEGLILKSIDDPYFENKRIWLKLKSLHLIDKKREFDLYAVRVMKDRNGLPSILECGYFNDSNEFVFVTKVSSGIDHNRRGIFKLAANEETGIFYKPIIVTIIADKVTGNKSLRHPSLYRIRHDLETIAIDDELKI